MVNLLKIYDCPHCGEVLSDEVVFWEDIDVDSDKIYSYFVCKECGRNVKMKVSKDEKGNDIYHYKEVDEERAKWANGFYDHLFDENFEI